MLNLYCGGGVNKRQRYKKIVFISDKLQVIRVKTCSYCYQQFY